MNIIQIGCNDCEDHVFEFISKHRDQVSAFMVVDALYGCVEIAKRKYSFLGSRLIPVTCAVGPLVGLTEFYFPQGEETSAHASMSVDHLRNHQHPMLQSVVVPCLSLNVLVTAFSRPVDRLYIDLEGADVDVLLGFDLGQFQPKFLEYEYLHADGTFKQGDKQHQLLKHLKAHRYFFRQSVNSAYNIEAQLVPWEAVGEKTPICEQKSESVLDAIIPGEIKNDSFYHALRMLAASPDVKTILEIGSSAGGGSTEAFVAGLKERSEPAKLYCMEISKTRFAQLRDTYQAFDCIHCFNVSSVPVCDFPSHETVGEFWDQFQSGLRAYARDTVLGWLDADIDYVRNHGSDSNGIELIKSDCGIERFDVVLIDGSEFTGEAELRHVYGAKYIALDDISTYKNWKNYFQLKEDPNYEIVAEERSVRNGYCIFKRVEFQKQLPVHFFTIVLNGMPFIKYHIDMMVSLTFDWHWHIVEGVADLKHDTAWSVGNGGAVTEDFHMLGRSRDGTTEYLDELAARYPDNVSIYRKPVGSFWEGKVEMVNAPLTKIRRDCLLWEIDADELWTAEKVTAGRNLLLSDHSLTSAFYWCHYFVGPAIVVSTRNCYSQNPGMEWLRTWRYHPSCRWVAHEPPRLVALQPDGSWADQGAIKPLRHAETEAAGLVFHHYAYTTLAQLRFKEAYYGYSDAVDGWNRLQSNERFPCFLKDYFSWVHDETQVDTSERLGFSALPGTDWLFESGTDTDADSADIIVDAVFFQYYNTGIARVWRSLLSEWAATDFGKRLLVLDRAGKAPRIPGLRYIDFPSHDYGNTALDQQLIQNVCDYKSARLFVSTYYTSPVSTPSLLMVYDMIPEMLKADLNHPMWIEKDHAVKRASAYICISENTAKDLTSVYSEITEENVRISHTGVSFQKPSAERLNAFQDKYKIEKPYFLISGGRGSYKNVVHFFEGFAKFNGNRGSFGIVCTGPAEALQPDFAALAGNASIHLLDLPDQELECAYAGAIALVYPSLYEGFGMPIIEAMACGCPVITCPNGPIPEVAGEAAMFVSSGDVDGMHQALERIQQAGQRDLFIAKGLKRAALFSWRKMADEIAAIMTKMLVTP